ncbi:MAG: tRNA (adenosine(37)-N6)-dimethylallyltransferase MiaA, partial [Rhodospirillaceae bacterium]|nr:tRNA (adenosine(37)-N6)-dimethylallyltransferase MiaA [Rhodospirillaceae bacterium]
GELLFEEAVSAGQQTTRRYVKRQGTWFKNQFIADIEIETQYNIKFSHKFFSIISKFVLT